MRWNSSMSQAPAQAAWRSIRRGGARAPFFTGTSGCARQTHPFSCCFFFAGGFLAAAASLAGFLAGAFLAAGGGGGGGGLARARWLSLSLVRSVSSFFC